MHKFNKICEQFKVNLSKQDMQTISDNYEVAGKDNQSIRSGMTISGREINFKTLSVRLGLHKDSYNHLGGHHRTNSKIRKLFQMRNKILEIEPVEENFNENNSIYENDYQPKDVPSPPKEKEKKPQKI